MYVFQLHIFQICSGITCGRVLNGELYAQRFQTADKVTSGIWFASK